MARSMNLEKMSYGELTALRNEIDAVLARKQAEEKEALKSKLAEMAKASGFSIEDIVGKGVRGGKGSVPIKYRDPKNAQNTWTGRGRMPRWMVAATKQRGVKKEDFLI